MYNYKYMQVHANTWHNKFAIAKTCVKSLFLEFYTYPFAPAT